MIFLPDIAILDLVILATFLLGLCCWLAALASEDRLKKTIQEESDESLFTSQFKCVVFSAGNRACRNALVYQTKPVLISSAPDIPLPGCSVEKCTCSLVQYDDRRTGKDRRDLERLDIKRKSAYADKRLLTDRRRASIQDFLLPKYRTFI
jgi:hypothetical protein